MSHYLRQKDAPSLYARLRVTIEFGARNGDADVELAEDEAHNDLERALRAFERHVAWVEVRGWELLGFDRE